MIMGLWQTVSRPLLLSGKEEHSMDTIAAIATPRGVGGVSMIRISGDRAACIADAVFKTKVPPSKAQPNLLQYGSVMDGDKVLDHGMCVLMHAPHSFTGEDVAELHVHGGMHLTDRVLQCVLDAGARMALPGEFTRRAFMNGKIDLPRAEAIGDLIHGLADATLSTAINQLEGRLSSAINRLRDQIIDITAQLSVAADYPEEDIPYLSGDTFRHALMDISNSLGELIASARGGQMMRDGVRCAIVGRPNTGKSSLLNAITGTYRAIVTPMAGTTRDIVEATVSLGGMAVTLGDTAGMREGEAEAEKLGIALAKEYAEKADFCLVVLDSSRIEAEDREILSLVQEKPHIVVLNKKDIAVYEGQIEGECVAISTVTGDGLSALEEAIVRLIDRVFLKGGALRQADAVCITNTRQRDGAVKAKEAIDFALQTLADGFPPDLTAVDLENAAKCLGEITGLCVSEEVISRIFAKFCLGK